MEVILLLVVTVLVAVTLIVFCIATVSLHRIADSLSVISYTLENNGINLDTKNDIATVAREVAKTKDRIKKLEVREELTKHKVENLSREVNSYNSVTRSKNLH